MKRKTIAFLIVFLIQWAGNVLSAGKAADIVTVDGLSFVNTLLLPGSEPIDDSQHYLKTALDGMNLNLPNTTVTAFHWSRDAGETAKTVESLREFLKQKYRAAQQNGKRFIIVAHSWGTVLTYLALSSQSMQAEPGDRVYVDLYITLGSPLGTKYAHDGAKYPEETLVIDFTDDWTERYSFCDECLPLVTRWVNYWAWGDVISGPFSFMPFSSNSRWEDVKIDGSSSYSGYFSRNTATTVTWHLYDSLQPGGLVDNQPLLDAVKQEIEKNGVAVDEPPFGSFDLPVDNSAASGSIAVTGWALDDVELENVKIYRGAVTGENPGMVFIDYATFIPGARPDVQQAFPGYPNADRAGWGYMLLTNFLPGKGNGTFTLYAVAEDSSGQTTALGEKTIICDNANAVKPFGAIDTPAQGGTASGAGYVNYGWALTPQPNEIPKDGSTIDVWINGKNAGHPVYNQYRKDIAAFFPGYANSEGAVGYFYLDTTQYENGIYTIQWTVTDNAGNSDGIGSRYFTIKNNANIERSHSRNSRNETAAVLFRLKNLRPGIETGPESPVWYRTGYNRGEPLRQTISGERITIGHQARLEIHFGEPMVNFNPLPVGSSMDARDGIFYWQPGPGFLGTYELYFLSETGKKPKKINVFIGPKKEED